MSEIENLQSQIQVLQRLVYALSCDALYENAGIEPEKYYSHIKHVTMKDDIDTVEEYVLR